jgi:hypothetical protein
VSDTAQRPLTSGGPTPHGVRHRSGVPHEGVDLMIPLGRASDYNRRPVWPGWVCAGEPTETGDFRPTEDGNLSWILVVVSPTRSISRPFELSRLGPG